MPTIPKQNSTRVRFCSNISACIARRTSTAGRRHKAHSCKDRRKRPLWNQDKTDLQVTQNHHGAYKNIMSKNISHKSNTSRRGTSEVDNRTPHSGKQCLGTTACQLGWLYWLRSLPGKRFTVKTNQASPSSMSLEKRVRMRPRGVVSKKCMGLRRRRLNSLSCSAEAAFTVHCQDKRHVAF